MNGARKKFDRHEASGCHRTKENEEVATIPFVLSLIRGPLFNLAR